MNKKIKNIIKRIIGKKTLRKIALYKRIYRKNKTKFNLLKYLITARIYKCKNQGIALRKLFSKVKINSSNKDKFYYYIDLKKTIYDENNKIGNLTIDYKKTLDYSLEDLKIQIEKSKNSQNFYENETNIVKGIEILINRIIKKLKSANKNIEIINNLNNIKYKKAESFYEALQRILFYNQLLWQTGHHLNGLGRLDMILISYYEKDIENGNLLKENARDLIKEFLLTLHKFYEYKSNTLLGDTGQIIELGGIDINGEYQCNDLTYMFIELIDELQLPDPKILLRVCSNMPRDLMNKSLKCIQTGIGCPLFANDEVIIDRLIKFGYAKEDAYNYGTSACWEPYIIGKSFDQNNINSINFIKPFEILLENENLDNINNIEQLIKIYKKYLEIYLDNFIEEVEKIEWQDDPLLSLFIDDCIKNNKDVAKGGAVYKDYGFTGVALSNLVNSIVNIDEFVFKNKNFTFSEINEIRKNNFKDNDILLKKLKKQKIKYGNDNEKIISMSNQIIQFTTKVLNKYTNPLGGRYKFGLSAPSYIEESKNFPASFDGRKDAEPFGVHISCDSPNGYTEIMQFASKLDYGENRFNGNVVDFMVSPSFIENNFDKFVDFLLLSIKNGFFEMQMNVVSSDILIEAKENPEKFPNLIVRVWGFSAYFNDLPDSYKNNLIERALKSEGIS